MSPIVAFVVFVAGIVDGLEPAGAKLCDLNVEAYPVIERQSVGFKLKNASEKLLVLPYAQVPWRRANSLRAALVTFPGGVSVRFMAAGDFLLPEDDVVLEPGAAVDGDVRFSSMFVPEDDRVISSGFFIWSLDLRRQQDCILGGVILFYKNGWSWKRTAVLSIN